MTIRCHNPRCNKVYTVSGAVNMTGRVRPPQCPHCKEFKSALGKASHR